MDVANYLINLKDGMSGPASVADGALRKLESTIRQEQGALAGLESKLGTASAKLAELQSGFGGKVDIAAVQRAQTAVDKLNASISQKKEGIGALKDAAPAYDKLSASAKESAAAQEAHAGRFRDFAEGAKGAKGGADAAAQGMDALKDKMPQLEGNLGKAQQALMKMGPAGMAVAAVLTAIVIVATAVIGTMYKLASAAVSISQEKDALANTFKALSTGAESGRELVDSLSEVAAQLPFAEGEVLKWGKSLMSAGIEGKGLAVAVKAVASATALMGEEGGAAVINWEKQLAAGGDAAKTLIKTVQDGGKKAAMALSEMGLQTHDLAMALGVTDAKFKTMSLTAEQLSAAMEEALINKGAKSLAALGLTWKSITGKLGDAWDDLFEDMGSAVSPFMAEIKSLFAEFSAGGTAQGLTKSLLVSFLTTLFEVATKVTHWIHIGFLEVEIAMLKVYIFLAPLINAFRALMGNTTFLHGIATILKIIGVAILAIVIPLAIITGAFLAVSAVVWSVVGAIIGALTWCVGDASRAAGDIISGLVGGLASGASAVASAMSNLAHGALNAFKSVLGIHSPSAVMRLQGRFTGEGAALGIDDSAADVEASAGAMAQGAADAGPKGSAGGRSSGGNTYHVSITVPPGTQQGMMDFLEAGVRKLFELEANAEPMPEGA